VGAQQRGGFGISDRKAFAETQGKHAGAQALLGGCEVASAKSGRSCPMPDMAGSSQLQSPCRRAWPSPAAMMVASQSDRLTGSYNG